jgi:hypothetical protein
MYVMVPNGFFTGDQGAKLLQTRAILQHGPIRPWIDTPRDLDPSGRFRDPELVMRAVDGRFVSIFPWALPLVTAPFYAAFGARGLYVVPALSVLVAFGASVRISRSLGARGVQAGWCAVAATPLLFYGAEFWEHAPASALTTAAVAAAFPSPPDSLRCVVAGVLVGIAALFRPEAALILPAICVGSAVAAGVKVAWRLMLLTGCAFLAITLIGTAMNVVVYGTIVSPQITENMGLGFAHFTATRREILSLLLLPAQGGWLFCLALASVAGSFRPSASLRYRLLSSFLFAVVCLMLAVVVPAAQILLGTASPLAAFNPASIAHTWIFAAALPFLTVLPRRVNPDGSDEYLLATTIAFVGLALLFMPHAGGAQWGARFLLPSAPLIGIAISVSLERARSADTPKGIRASIAVLLLLSVVVQGFGIAVLAKHKAMHAQMAAVVEAQTRDGDVIVSDIVWTVELLARLSDSRRLLYVASRADVDRIGAALSAKGIDHMIVISSAQETGLSAPTIITGGFQVASTSTIGLRGLTLITYWR